MSKQKTKTKTLRLAIVGLGCRSVGLLKLAILGMKDIEIACVCDKYEDRVKSCQDLVKKKKHNLPRGYVDYKELIEQEKNNIDCAIISTSWDMHTEMAIAFMEAGVPVGSEVAGAYSIEECWRLVDAYERTKTPYMFMENCCYGAKELTVLNMYRQGIIGEISHCSGGYQHDLRSEILFGKENRHYRLEEYRKRNCENYPTHEIGPISKILDINYGNTFTTLVSMASGQKGLNKYAEDRQGKYPCLKEFVNTPFAQGDVVTTMLKCANGETVTIKLDTTLPRMYSRGFEVHGTKGSYVEDSDIYTDDRPCHKNEGVKHSGKYMLMKYLHPIWKWFIMGGVKGGHGGMDYLVLRAFFEAVKKGDGHMPIDVYDGACWMAITALSAQSIQGGSVPVEFPDFTRGAWKSRKQEGEGMFFLERKQDTILK